MKILVTGAAGFIGTNFIYYWIENHPEDEIVALDALTYAGCHDNLIPAVENAGISFVKLDITDRKGIFGLFAKNSFDVVVNFAAESHVDRSINDPGVFIETNVKGTQILMDACLGSGVKRFHQISTDEVYGDLPLDSGESFTEDSVLRPSSPYSASKASADLLVGAYIRTYGLKATISRCSNNYGPYQFPEKLIPLVISNAMNDMSVPVYGNGKNIRDWIYVKDHCRAVDMIIRYGSNGEIYNIGAGNEISNIDLVRQILDKLGKSQDLIKFVEDRRGHDLRYSVDCTKIVSELGWSPLFDFIEGRNKTIDWYISVGVI